MKMLPEELWPSEIGHEIQLQITQERMIPDHLNDQISVFSWVWFVDLYSPDYLKEMWTCCLDVISLNFTLLANLTSRNS